MGRRRQRRPTVNIDAIYTVPAPLSTDKADPEEAIAVAEIRRLLERAADDLPEAFRIVFVMCDVEEMSTEETALFWVCSPRR